MFGTRKRGRVVAALLRRVAGGLVATTGALAVVLPASLAAGERGAIDALQECRTVTDLSERLGCYDRLADSLGSDSRGQAAASSEGREVPAERSRARPEAASETIKGRIAELRTPVPNRHLLTLEDGSVWRQTDGRRYRLLVGDEVEVVAPRWGGSHRLTAERLGSFILVAPVE